MQLFWISLAVLGAGLILLVANHDAGSVFGIENNAFASLLYLGLWASVLVVGVLGSRRGLSHSLRDLAYWMLILLVLMTGYQYRYELQDVVSRLTAGLVPGSPITLSGGSRASVMLEKSANGLNRAGIAGGILV
ncbi:hypothetical protein NYR54_03435 [Chelativorans sp. SCAU2101]|uniref:Uncharacterized protein n=1 Tax=Chelativorans petroleitrophicus TaxID=2975484 RepID=A0A9X2X747_9HYPH|nr:hypothetical protein [Chelativorans petroleitrophicus]MCT8989351.1 hypothetical protein [Chelativorans petroleitrophicus]